jgi:hypothetical protein
MTTSVRYPTPGCQVGRTPTAPKHARIDEIVADRLNMRPASVHNRRFGPRAWHTCLAEILRTAVAEQQWTEVERLMAPIRDALRGPGDETLESLRHRAQMDDIAEDLAEERVRHDDTPENRAAHLKALRAQNFSNGKLADYMAVHEANQ